MALLEFTKKGIYCAAAGVYIDPWKKVSRALITHAHADHARAGMGRYLCHHHTAPILKLRLGKDIKIQTVEYGERTTINGVHFSFHPAGHLIGSSQIRVEYKGEIWVVSGDYKTEDDGLATPFEPVKCDVFITESTFGLPVYRWRPQREVFRDINTWWRTNRELGKTSILFGYSLGKAQRLLQHIDASTGPVYTHGAVANINQAFEAAGIAVKSGTYLDTDTDRKKLAKEGALVVAPPATAGSAWMRKLQPASTAMASGWMALRGTRRWQSVDRGFALSDHADWDGLNGAITATGAQKVIVTHGYTAVFTRWLQEQGLEAMTEKTAFENEDPEISMSNS